MKWPDLHQETSLTTSTVTDDNELATDFSHFSVITKNNRLVFDRADRKLKRERGVDEGEVGRSCVGVVDMCRWWQMCCCRQLYCLATMGKRVGTYNLDQRADCVRGE